MDFVVVTTEDAEGKTSEEYADDYYDYNGYAEDGVLYLIDLDNGSVWISTAGKMIRYLTDARIDVVIDAGYDNLKAKNYADGILEMLNETESYLEDGIPSDQYNYDTETGKISRYRLKRKTYRYPYESRAKVHFTRRDDQFRHRSITQRRIPREPPSGGGGGQSRTYFRQWHLTRWWRSEPVIFYTIQTC